MPAVREGAVSLSEKDQQKLRRFRERLGEVLPKVAAAEREAREHPINEVAESMRAVTDRTYGPEHQCVCGTTCNPEPAEPGTRYWCSLCPDGKVKR